MTTLAPERRTPQAESRAARAAARAEAARHALASCRLCAHECGVDRSAGESGLCRATDRPRVHLAQIDLADELELIPTFAIALSGCDLRCAFCITGAQSWNPGAGVIVPPDRLADRAVAALREGARTITFLGGEPTIHAPFLLEVVAALPESARLVLKTNAFLAAAGRTLLLGLFDVWCADFKFGNDACALRLARIPGYTQVVPANLRWMAADSELIVRHLLLPGHVECCWQPVAEWLGTNLPGVKVSLRDTFWPAWQSDRHAELRGRTVSAAESARARDIAARWALNLIE